MGKLRFLFALWMAKLSVPALKITRHNGTDFPGTLALKLCPDFLKYVGRPKTIIAVTGTNGKTTVSNLLADTLEKEGHRVLINRAGSNVASGIATALLKGCDLAGRVKNHDMAVLEVDERSSVRVYPYITPDYIAVTNLFRDSIMRNAHAEFIADIISRSVPASSRLAAWLRKMNGCISASTACPRTPWSASTTSTTCASAPSAPGSCAMNTAATTTLAGPCARTAASTLRTAITWPPMWTSPGAP